MNMTEAIFNDVCAAHKRSLDALREALIERSDDFMEDDENADGERSTYFSSSSFRRVFDEIVNGEINLPAAPNNG